MQATQKSWVSLQGSHEPDKMKMKVLQHFFFSCMIVIWIKVASNGWTPYYNIAIKWLSFLWVWRVDGCFASDEVIWGWNQIFWSCIPHVLHVRSAFEVIMTSHVLSLGCACVEVDGSHWFSSALVKNPLLLSLTGALHCRVCFKTTSYLNEVKGEVCHYIWMLKCFLVCQLKGIVHPKIKLTQNVLTLRHFEM